MLANDLSETLSLDGAWKFRLGEDFAWSDIEVPGCWEAQDFDKYLDGPAFYQRKFDLPMGWSHKRIQLEFDAVSYTCEVMLNGVCVGRHRGLWTPFAFEMPNHILREGENTLEIQVYKPGMQVETVRHSGERQPDARHPMRSSLAGFIPDVATTFGGIWQSVRLRLVEYALEGFSVDVEAERGSLRVRCFVDTSRADSRLALESPAWGVSVFREGEQVVDSRPPFSPELDTDININNHELWEQDNPVLYTVEVCLYENGEPVAKVTQRTGFRSLTAKGSQLLLNGKPFMVRGILSWGWEPATIAPAYSLEQARGEIRRIKRMGFNMVKLCLFVPNQAYFDAADEEGMLLWEELPMWLPEVTTQLRQDAPQEYAEITRLVRHHPSIVIYSLGCEMNAAVDSALLERLDQAVRHNIGPQANPGVLVCDNSGSGESYDGLDVDFADFKDYHPYYDLHFFEPLLDNWRRDWEEPRPWIFGEFCDADTFRDQREIIAANGGERPWWLTTNNPVTAWRSESKAMLEAEKRLEIADLPFSPADIRQASYAQAHVVRKYTFESLRLRSGMGGYIVTGLRDTPISTSGIWDDLGQPKWSPQEFAKVNGDTILCLDVGRRRQWRYGGDRPDRLDAYNFHSGEIVKWHVILHTTDVDLVLDDGLSWGLYSLSGERILEGLNPILKKLSPGKPDEVATVVCRLPEVTHASEFILKAKIHLQDAASNKNLEYENQWAIFVYPKPDPGSLQQNFGLVDPSHVLDELMDTQDGWSPNHGKFVMSGWLDSLHRLDDFNDLGKYPILITTVWNQRLHEYTTLGGRVLLLQPASGTLPVKRCPFWRESIQLFHPHPIWDDFPQQGFAGMQFFGLASDVAFESEYIRQFPEIVGFRPILRRLDAREFLVTDYIFEAKIGKGILVGCSLRLNGGMGKQPDGLRRNVAGNAMLETLLKYLDSISNSENFKEERQSMAWTS